MSVWFKDPAVLFEKDELMDFWPTAKQNVNQRINSTTRFVVYISLLLFFIQRDVRVLVLAAVAIGALFAFYKADMVAETAARPVRSTDRASPGFMRSVHQAPTLDNPMGNVLMTDYRDHPDRPPAAFYPSVRGAVKENLDDTMAQDAADIYGHRNQAASRFYSMPVSTIPGDQTGFAEWCYGKKFKPMCRSDQAACTAEGNTRMPELPQMRASTGALAPTYFPSPY
jgi:hypothetical protein